MRRSASASGRVDGLRAVLRDGPRQALGPCAGVDALTLGEGDARDDPDEAIAASYAAGVTDEFVLPTVIVDGWAPVAPSRTAMA